MEAQFPSGSDRLGCEHSVQQEVQHARIEVVVVR
jgi:hypothetical protein